jgi:hypothetical protein
MVIGYVMMECLVRRRCLLNAPAAAGRAGCGLTAWQRCRVSEEPGARTSIVCPRGKRHLMRLKRARKSQRACGISVTMPRGRAVPVPQHCVAVPPPR